MKLKKITKKISIIIVTILFTLIAAVVFYFLFIKKDYESVWYSESWSYRKAIFLDIPNTISNVHQDLLIEVNTQKLIAEGKLQNDCRDLRFVDENNSSTLKYWIEGGCNTPNSQIWVNVRVRKESEKVIYMYYGNKIAPDGQEAWDGEFITISLNECSQDWSVVDDLKGRFPLADTTYGKTGGNESHSHNIFQSIGTENCIEKVYITTADQEECDTNRDNIMSNNTTSFRNIPNYLDVNYCSSNNGYLTDSTIILADNKTPTQWKHVSQLDEKFPRGKDEKDYNLKQSHKHNLSCINKDLSYVSGKEKYLTLNSMYSTDTVSEEPPYFTINFISNSNGGVIPHGSILMVTELPPLGWEGYTDIEGRLIKGANENFENTGGTDTHSHKISIDYSIKNSTIQKLLGLELEQLCLPLEKELNLWQSQNMPPFLTVIYAKKKSKTITKIETETVKSTEDKTHLSNSNQKSTNEISISFDEEKTKEEVQKDEGDVLGAATPTTPTSLLTEGQTNPTDITDSTPKFSAIYNDPDTSDTTSFYQIEVNTSSDFSGTVMWDSNKSSMTTTNQGNRSPDISYAGVTLAENTTYYWRIRFWDSDDNVSPWSANASFSLASTPIATSLLTCGNSNPTFITNNLTFSAIYSDPGDTNATAYEIEVNTLSDFTGTVMWDSTKISTTIISGQRSTDIPYSGSTVAHEGTTYYVRLRFWDGNDTPSQWVTGQFVDILKGFRLDGFNMEGINLE